MIRLAVTTTADEQTRVAEMAVSAGFTPVALPCVTIKPESSELVAAMRRACSKADLIIITSPRAVRVLWPTGGMPPVGVAAVGEATARAVVSAGGRVEVTGVEGFDRLVEQIRMNGRRVVYPHGRNGMADITRLTGRSVVSGPVYDVEPIAPDPGIEVETVMFASPSAVRGWCLSRTLDGMVIGAIGGTTARHLAEVGYPPQVVAERPGFTALVEAMAGWWRRTERGPDLRDEYGRSKV